MKETENHFLGEEKISKLLLKFSFPCILSLLISSLYNIVDQIFIGNSSLGYLGNAATTIVFPITVIAVAFAWCFGDGAAAFLSLCQGRKDTKQIHQAVGNSLLMTFLISVAFLIVGFCLMDPILTMFGASKSSMGLAKDYYVIILAAIPVYMLMNAMNSIIRADGSPLFAMASMLVGAIVNIILDPLFIFTFDLGIKGAAYATIIGQILSFFIAFGYFFRSKTFQLTKESFSLQRSLLGTITKLGISTFITQMSIVIISVVCNIMLARYGANSKYGPDIPIAAIGIAMKVFTIVINIVVGIIIGGQPILGYNYGAKQYDRIRKTFRLILISTLVVGILATICFLGFPDFVVGIFGNESELYNEFARMTFQIFLSLVLFTCVIKMTSIFFQAVGKPIKSALVSLIRDLICFVPLVFLLPNWMGIKGVLYAAPIADGIGFLISIFLISSFFYQLEKEVMTNDSFSVISPSSPGVIITISREHGSNGKYIGSLLAHQLGIPYYDKELTALAAKESGLSEAFMQEVEDKTGLFYDLYLSTTPAQYAVEAQEQAILKIAAQGSCVMVGRDADYVLREHKNVISIFLCADLEDRIEKVMQLYGDTREEALKHIRASDKARATYYKTISSFEWGCASNYDLCINSGIGVEETSELIATYVKNYQK